MAELDSLSFFLIGASLIAALLFARSLYKFQKEGRRMHKKIQDKASDLEFQAQSLKSDFRDLSESNRSKVDLDYLNKRIDALISLLNTKR